jgi:transposase
VVIADKAYSHPSTRIALRPRHIQFRGLATRHAKRAAYYQAELTIAAIILWLR